MELKEDYGYDKERFPALAGESFDCVICTLVVRDPKECTNCGSMFCKACIDGWLLKKKECPKRCAINQTTIKPIGKALHRIYQDLDIRCKYFSTCKQTIKLADIEAHEANCNLPKCLNYDFCKNNVKSKNKSELLCDPTCILFAKIRDCGTDYKKTRKVLEEHFKSYIPSSGPTFSISSSSGSKGGVTSFKWDATHIGSGIELSSDRKVAYLNEGPYMFRSIIGDTAFTGGINYWEIHGDSRTENELKIGVAAKKEFNYNSAFADYEFGFSYYGLGQLRHGSNASGAPYGKRFKKEGVLGICLDMNKGTLSFALDGEYFGVAYTSELLKKGPVYAAVSLLHCAALKLVTDKPCPEYFLK